MTPDLTPEEWTRVREAVEPFARLADRYDPPEDDDHEAAWDVVPSLGDLRRARAILPLLDRGAAADAEDVVMVACGQCHGIGCDYCDGYGHFNRPARPAPAAQAPDGWPNGCIKPNSCSRNRQCMYAMSKAQCRHFDEDIGPAIDAAAPSPTEEPTR